MPVKEMRYLERWKKTHVLRRVWKGMVQLNYMIYLLTAIGLSPGGRSTVHIYSQTIYRTIQNKNYIEQHNNFGRVQAVPSLG